MNSQYYMFSLCLSLTSTVTGGLALCYLTVHSSYSIWTADTQTIQVFSNCVNCALCKIYPTTASPYRSSTTLSQRANLWRNACMYVCMYVCMSLQHCLCFHTLAKLVTPHRKLHSMLQSQSCC
jgi:hypothetical protein